MGIVRVTRAVLPSMIDRQEGCIVLVCSQAGQVCLLLSYLEGSGCSRLDDKALSLKMIVFKFLYLSHIYVFIHL